MKAGQDAPRRKIDQSQGGEDGIVKDQHGERAKKMLEPQRQALLADEGDAAIEGEESAPAGDGKERIAHCGISPGGGGGIALPLDPYACNAAHHREQHESGQEEKGHRKALMRLVPIMGGARVDLERHR